MAWRDWLGLGQRAETRAVTVDDVFNSGSSDLFWLSGAGSMAATGEPVTIDRALGVPAVACAVNFIAETVAGLPRDYYRRDRKGNRSEGTGPLVSLIKDAVNDEQTAFEWTKGMLLAKLTGGRGMSYIERDSAGRAINFWAMDPARVTVRQDGFTRSYEYRDGRRQVYQASEVIDLPFMLCADGLKHRGPIAMGRDAIGLAIAATEYGSKFFHGGGVPPFVITGNFQTPGAMQRAADDLSAAVRKAKGDKRLALALPAGHEIKQLGVDPEKAQLVEVQRFSIEQIARIFSIPPTFLQDLTHGTYSNTEQQDLHFVKHTLMRHVRQFEQELNLKLFGRANRNHYVEFNVDGIQRGDFKSRMEGWARGIQTGLVTPNEARRAENYTDMAGGDRLFMQGATVPIDQAGTQDGAAAPGA